VGRFYLGHPLVNPRPKKYRVLLDPDFAVTIFSHIFSQNFRASKLGFQTRVEEKVQDNCKRECLDLILLHDCMGLLISGSLKEKIDAKFSKCQKI
jgi:hypothetical protein